jgi:hypothetical protein
LGLHSGSMTVYSGSPLGRGQVDERFQHCACGVFGMLLTLYLAVAVITFKTALDQRKDPPVSVTRKEQTWTLPNLVRACHSWCPH